MFLVLKTINIFVFLTIYSWTYQDLYSLTLGALSKKKRKKVGVSFIYNDFLKFLHNNKFIPKKIKKNRSDLSLFCEITNKNGTELSIYIYILNTLGFSVINLLLKRCNFSNMVRYSKTSGKSSRSLFPQFKICN